MINTYLPYIIGFLLGAAFMNLCYYGAYAKLVKRIEKFERGD